MTESEIKGRVMEYIDSLRSMETDRWVREYAENGTAEDPVGTPIIRGHENLRSFFNDVKKNIKLLDMKPEIIIVGAPEVAIKWTTKGVMQTGQQGYFNGISIFKFAEDGKILQMRAFWDPQEVARQIK